MIDVVLTVTLVSLSLSPLRKDMEHKLALSSCAGYLGYPF